LSRFLPDLYARSKSAFSFPLLPNAACDRNQNGIADSRYQ
jgi:hypothetical protein